MYVVYEKGEKKAEVPVKDMDLDELGMPCGNRLVEEGVYPFNCTKEQGHQNDLHEAQDWHGNVRAEWSNDNGRPPVWEDLIG